MTLACTVLKLLARSLSFNRVEFSLSIRVAINIVYKSNFRHKESHTYCHSHKWNYYLKKLYNYTILIKQKTLSKQVQIVKFCQSSYNIEFVIFIESNITIITIITTIINTIIFFFFVIVTVNLQLFLVIQRYFEYDERLFSLLNHPIHLYPKQNKTKQNNQYNQNDYQTKIHKNKQKCNSRAIKTRVSNRRATIHT